MMRAHSFAGFLKIVGTVGVAVACGGSEPTPKTADDTPAVTSEDRPGITASAEIGGMNEDAVDAAFKSSVKSLQGCLDKGATRVEFLGGSVNFFLKINSRGKVEQAYLERSTIGDRATERCMLDALRAKSWPKPVGGEHGLARKSFDFDPPNDVRPPTEWGEDDAAPGLKKIAPDLQACKDGRRGAFEATLYVDTEGKVLAASVTPPDEDGDAAVDCMVQILEAASFPSPGSWPAKVTLNL
jgi:hypothetical protein